VCADRPDVDADLFRAVNERGLVYDGRLVVNTRMRTTDEAVYACGPVTKLSRRFRVPYTHAQCNAREMGAKLAACVLQAVDPLAGTVAEELESAETAVNLRDIEAVRTLLPDFRLPRGVRCMLPHGVYYLSTRVPEVVAPTKELVTNPQLQDGALQYCKLLLDRHGRVGGVTYLGTQPVEAQNLERLVGLHEGAVGSLRHQFDTGAIHSLVDLLREEWAQALFHDRFAQFCLDLRVAAAHNADLDALVQEVKSQAAHDNPEYTRETCMRLIGVGGERLTPGLRKATQRAVAQFLTANRELLPRFFLPQ